MEEFGKLIYKLKVGSHLYGLQRPESDEDFMGVFIPKSEYVLGLKNVNEVDSSTKSSASQFRNTKDDVDDKSYALPKFLHLTLQNNPNIVEVLFANSDSILHIGPEMEELIANKDKLISKRVFHTFTGYAYSQKKKLTVKSERYKSLVEGVDFVESRYSKDQLTGSYQINESESEMLNNSLKYYKGQKHNCESFHKGMSIKMIYEKLVEERDNYGWRVKTDTFEKLGFDCKFGYNLIRILAEGYELLSTGKIDYPIKNPYREDIIRVREGEVELEELLSIYDKYDALCKEAYETSPLPYKPDFNWANDWLIKTLKKSIISEEF